MLTPRLRARINKIVRALKPYDPEQIIVFGSAARGDADRHSDIDIAIIKETNERFLDRLAQVYKLIQPDFALDALVYTPSEFAAMRARRNPFAEEIVRDGIVVYAKGKPAARNVKMLQTKGRRVRKQAIEEARRWLEQARVDLETATWNRQGNFHAAACFWAQQAAEKALKAFLYAQGERYVKGHSVATLCKEAIRFNKEFSSVTQQATELDRYYIPTRYPNGLPDGIPAESYSYADAQRAVAQAREIFDLVKRLSNV
ncbi:MAG: HEPN domain-containing protein [Anaerolineae bacterium]|nr:HEPN domain-containing protein [Anaerolineae bacterium]